MPQMMPLNWLSLFFFFILLFLMFNIVNYFIFLNKSTSVKTEKTKISYSWKW